MSATGSGVELPQKLAAAAADRAPRERGRFVNRDARRRPSSGQVMRWMLGGGPRDPHDERPRLDAIPTVPASAEALRADAPAGVTWIGHATTLIHLPGLRLLTDPVWGAPTGVPRLTRAAAPIDAIEGLDAVLISHNHRDHLDRRTIRRLPAELLYLVPEGLGYWMRAQGRRRVVELDWWDAVELAGGRITFVPAQHWSRRGMFDENRSLWGGYVVEAGGARVYFAGDSGWFDGFAEIGARLAPQVAILPIGAYAPRWFMRTQHVDPAEALAAARAVGAVRLLPIHWGTFRLSAEPPEEPLALLAQCAAEQGESDRVVRWPVGGTYWLSP
ncbi:MAG: MBL fold metallo-hydrolase [Deltaproteobacteria bacterium]|nr:MBL fold metallo-hydrolase [Deltaproteobacteria bacterium]